jgi:hypothetical protein
MLRHHRDVEKDLRHWLLEPEAVRFRRSSAFLESRLRTPNATLLQRLPKQSNATVFKASAPDYDVSSKTGFCGAMPRIRAVSKSAIESNSSVRKWLRSSSQRWRLVFILCQAVWNKGQHSC